MAATLRPVDPVTSPAVLSTTASYLSVSNNLARQQAATAAQPDVKTASAYYLAHIGKATSVSAFVNNFQLFSYAMKAYGLGDMVNAKGLITKLLKQGVSSKAALANTLSDPRYKAFATAFNFAANGATATQKASATTQTVSKYVEQTLEDNQAKTNQGVANALYFTREASSITSVYGLLANKTMLAVVQGAYGISPTSSQTDVDRQAAYLSKIVKISDLHDPAKVKKLVERYTSAYDLNNGSNVTNVLLATTSASGLSAEVLDAANGVSSTTSADSVLNLFNAGSSTNGISSSLLLSLSKLKHGGS